MKKALPVMFLAMCLSVSSLPLASQSQEEPVSLLDEALLRAVIFEASGELAFQNEIFLSGVNRNRKADEYRRGYFETAFLLDKLREYGVDEAEIINLPTREKTTWDAVSAELWIVEPGIEKICDLKEVPACLAQGSSSTDTKAEIVYVGPGNSDDYYKGRDVKGKIVLVAGPPDQARRIAVEKFGAAGMIAWSSSHPEYDRDQVGWNSIRVGEKEKPTFAFMVSRRMGEFLRDGLERGRKYVVRAVAETEQIGGFKEQMVSGIIRGVKYPDQELVFVAHLYEGLAKQGSNDNISGCTAILETARVLKKLTAEGKLPPLQRSVRFLFVPEISGSSAYLKLNPAIRKRMFACINLDMVGEGLVKNLSRFRLIQTPWSLPTYMNDVMASFVEWMGKSQEAAQETGWEYGNILAPTGSRDPFYYSIDPYSGGSDHMVFDDGGIRIPCAYLNVWPDQWYHTNLDTVDKSDPTEFKRTVVITSAAAAFLAGAGPDEAEKVLGETAFRGLQRLAMDRGTAEKYMKAADGKLLNELHKEAVNLLKQAVLREKEALASAAFFAMGDREIDRLIASRRKALDAQASIWLAELEDFYGLRCRRLGVKPEKPGVSPDEARLERLIPVRSERMSDIESMWRLREELRKMNYQPTPSIMMADWEMRNFIDGRRSILDIRNAASAEFGPLDIKEVEQWFEAYRKVGLLDIRER